MTSFQRSEDWFGQVEMLLRVFDDRRDLGILELRVGETRIRFERSVGRSAAGNDTVPAVASESNHKLPGGRSISVVPTGGNETSSTIGSEELRIVLTPTVGTFHRGSKPGSAPFIDLGALVNPDTTMALVETMGEYTSVTAGVRGIVEEIFPLNLQFVEFDQALFRVRVVRGPDFPQPNEPDANG